MLLRTSLLLLSLPILAARADPVQLHYNAYAAGLNVIALDAGLDVSPTRYRLRIDFHTTGAFGLFVHNHQDTVVDGVFAGMRAVPEHLYSAGVISGGQHITQIDYRDGEPVIRQLVPQVDKEREPIPPEQERGTVDTLSAMAQLIRQVNATGRCEGSTRTFDGRRLATMRAWTIGYEDVLPTRLSSFAGRALHCEFEGRQTGGFVLDEDRERLQRPQRGSAWFAAITPGGPLVPVRISFHTHWFGDATMYLAPSS